MNFLCYSQQKKQHMPQSIQDRTTSGTIIACKPTNKSNRKNGFDKPLYIYFVCAQCCSNEQFITRSTFSQQKTIKKKCIENTNFCLFVCVIVFHVAKLDTILLCNVYVSSTYIEIWMYENDIILVCSSSDIDMHSKRQKFKRDNGLIDFTHTHTTYIHISID